MFVYPYLLFYYCKISSRQQSFSTAAEPSSCWTSFEGTIIIGVLYYYSFMIYSFSCSQVTIPSTAVRTETNGKLFTIFILHVRADVPTTAETGGIQIDTKHWVVERRFSEFLRLHVGMRDRLPQLRVIPFPSKVVS